MMTKVKLFFNLSCHNKIGINVLVKSNKITKNIWKKILKCKCDILFVHEYSIK